MTEPDLESTAARLGEALRKAHQGPTKDRVRRAIARLSVPVLGADDQARFIVANDAAFRLTGYSEQELLRLSVPDITGPSDQPHTETLWHAFVRERQQSGTYELRRKDGSTVAVEYFALANAAPGVHLSLLRRLRPEETERTEGTV